MVKIKYTRDIIYDIQFQVKIAALINLCFETLSLCSCTVLSYFTEVTMWSILQYSSWMTGPLTWLVEGRGELLGHQSGDAGLTVGGLSSLFSCLCLDLRMDRPARDRCSTVQTWYYNNHPDVLFRCCCFEHESQSESHFPEFGLAKSFDQKIDTTLVSTCLFNTVG